MSESFLSDVSSALSQLFAKRLARQFNRITVLGASVPAEADVQGNAKNVAWDVEFSGSSAGSYAEGTDVQASEFAVDTLVPAVLSWGHYRSSFQVSETQLNAAFASRGSADAILKLLAERVMSNGAKLASVINSDLWSGTGTDGSGNPNIVGFAGGALAASGNYATISRAANAEWKGNVLSNGGIGRALTLDLLEQAEENIYRASSMQPTHIVCSTGVWRKYISLFEPIRRVEGAGPMPRYDTSVGAGMGVEQTPLFFKGIPVFRDKDAPAGTLLMLNRAWMKKAYLPEIPDASVDTPYMEMRPGEGMNGADVVSGLDLPFKVVALSKTGDSVKIMIKSVLQLKVERPNAMALVQDISES